MTNAHTGPRGDLNLKHFRQLLTREKERLEGELRDLESLDRAQPQSEELGETAGETVTDGYESEGEEPVAVGRGGKAMRIAPRRPRR